MIIKTMMLWWCSAKKRELAGLNARNEDNFGFTSHAGFEDVRDIAQYGHHVDQLDFHSIGQWA